MPDWTVKKVKYLELTCNDTGITEIFRKPDWEVSKPERRLKSWHRDSEFGSVEALNSDFIRADEW